jgi:hypothetical protein
LRSLLVIGEVALSLMLLVGSGLLLESFASCAASIRASARTMSSPCAWMRP